MLGIQREDSFKEYISIKSSGNARGTNRVPTDANLVYSEPWLGMS